MIDVTRFIQIELDALHTIAHALLTESAVSTNNSNHTRIHLPDSAPASEQTTAQAILDQYETLPVSASATALTEGDADPTITCDDSVIAGDTEMGYVVLLDGDLYADGTTPVNSGEASLTLVSPVAGTYDVYVYRLTGDYASGSVQLIVEEV